MCIDDDTLEVYLNRMTKRSSDEPISVETKRKYRTNIRQMRKSESLQHLLDPNLMKKIFDSLTIDHRIKSNRIMTLSLLLSVMKEEDLRRHFPNESDFSFERINGLITRYRRLCIDYKKNENPATEAP